MHMIDWNAYRQQVVAGVGGFAKLSPETVRGYGAMGAAGQKTGQLDAKTRELIAIAVAITLRCDGCVTVHTDAAHKLGAEGGGRGGAGRRCQRQRRCRHRLLDSHIGCLCRFG